MPTRYQQLRQAIGLLAQSADEQHAWLESLLGDLTPDAGASAYGSDELALAFGDIFMAAGDMLERGEISRAEIDAARPLDALLDAWSGTENADFWRREALWTDPRWEQVRESARGALSAFPDEERPSSRIR